MPTDEDKFEHPGLQFVYKTLLDLTEVAAEAGLPDRFDEPIHEVLDVLDGWCSGEYSVPALVERYARLGRLAKEAVDRTRKEHEEAILRIGDGRINKEASYAALLALYAAVDPRVTTSDQPRRTVIVELPEEWLPLLETLAGGPGLADVSEVLAELADHAQQGVYRPSSWERPWLFQAFGDAFLKRLEPDTRPERLSSDGRVIYDRPRGVGV